MNRTACCALPLVTLLGACPVATRAEASAEFRALCAQRAADGATMAVAGADGWLYLRSELRHIGVGPFWGETAAAVSKASSPDKADPLPAIVDFHRQLHASGIQLIVVPVPCKALIYPEPLGGPGGEPLDTVHQEFLRLLREGGVTVLDLATAFRTAKTQAGQPELYCRTDTHWSPYACEVAAREIKAAIDPSSGVVGPPEAFRTRPEQRVLVGDLTEGKGSETVPIRLVEAVDGAPLEDKTSPVVLLGDSHCLVYHAGDDLHGKGAGLADQLAAELGRRVDVLGVRGSGATPARVNLLRRAKAVPEYLAGKKVVVWCFAAREFTESTGWSVLKLPERAAAAELDLRGAVVHNTLEGGFWGIRGDDGRNYDPGALPEAFQKDGLRVRLKARVRENGMTIRMWGTLVDIVSLERE